MRLNSAARSETKSGRRRQHNKKSDARLGKFSVGPDAFANTQPFACKLGNSRIEVSVVGLGCNNFGGRMPELEPVRAVVHRALDLGITLFDTADVYGNRGGSETAMGEVLGDKRKDIVLATKFGMPMDDAGVTISIARPIGASA